LCETLWGLTRKLNALNSTPYRTRPSHTSPIHYFTVAALRNTLHQFTTSLSLHYVTHITNSLLHCRCTTSHFTNSLLHRRFTTSHTSPIHYFTVAALRHTLHQFTTSLLVHYVTHFTDSLLHCRCTTSQLHQFTTSLSLHYVTHITNSLLHCRCTTSHTSPIH